MNFQSEIYDGRFDDVKYSGVLDGMSDENRYGQLNRGLSILDGYGATQEPETSRGYLTMGTTIPLNMEDKQEMFDLGWDLKGEKWPPNSKAVEQYSFNAMKLMSW